MIIHSKYFRPYIIALYQIDGLFAEDEYVYIKIIKYGLKQAATISYNQLIYHMEPHGYYPVLLTTRVWAHKTRRKLFCIWVDDFLCRRIHLLQWVHQSGNVIWCLVGNILNILSYTMLLTLEFPRKNLQVTGHKSCTLLCIWNCAIKKELLLQNRCFWRWHIIRIL